MEAEKEGFQCDDRICILPEDETQELLKARQDYDRLTGHYTKLETEYNKLNEHAGKEGNNSTT